MPFPWTQIEAAWQLPEVRAWHRRLGEGRTLLVYDSRGMGLSDGPRGDFSLDALVSDLEGVADAVGLGPFPLMSAPTSGPVAIAYAARHPERVTHLVLWCTSSRGIDLVPPQIDALLALAEQDWPLYTETVAHAIIGWEEGEYAHRFAQFLRKCVTPAMNRAFITMLRAVDVTPDLSRIAAPTLVLHRRGAPWPLLEVVRAMAARIPQSRLTMLDGTSPAPFIGDLEAAACTIHDFLGDAPARPVPVASTAHTPVTILVTDVEGSTALTERLGDAGAREALRAHERIVRDALAAYGGSEVKTTGDGFIAAFPSATRALECAIAVQRALAVVPDAVRVRMGVNAGEPIAEAGDLFGTAVILAARVAGAASGGEILVADVVRQLTAGKGFRFTERGEVALRGFATPVRVCQVVWV
jgi:class 3 adenylate cyclase/pimeloyl-ACP methyl ester carboxylesterase